MESNIPRLVFPLLLISRLLWPLQKVIIMSAAVLPKRPLACRRHLITRTARTVARSQVLLNAIAKAAAFLLSVLCTMPSNKALLPLLLNYELVM